MIIVYGSDLCKDCRNLKNNLNKNGIPFKYVDINESMANLKDFLSYRDKNEELFKDIKEKGGVGLPLIKVDDKLTLDWEKYLINIGVVDIEYEELVFACNINGKGC